MSLLFAGLTLEDLVDSVIESLERSRTTETVRVADLILPAVTNTIRGARKSGVVPTFAGLEDVWRASRLLVEDDDQGASEQE
jgi:hypothetical protein